jgi:RNA polymerase sigma-70 factor (ECF subfamily)
MPSVSSNSTNELAVARELTAVAVPPVEHQGAQPSPQVETLYREHFDFVWRNARRLGCDDDELDDVVHEVFLIATRKLSGFEGRSAPRTWLFGITLRVVQHLRRDHARERRHALAYLLEQVPPVADAARESEEAQYLRHLLTRLSEPQRVVVILSELEGFSSAEIAKTLGIPAGTVDSRLRGARLELTRLIERERARQERWSK